MLWNGLPALVSYLRRCMITIHTYVELESKETWGSRSGGGPWERSLSVTVFSGDIVLHCMSCLRLSSGSPAGDSATREGRNWCGWQPALLRPRCLGRTVLFLIFSLGTTTFPVSLWRAASFSLGFLQKELSTRSKRQCPHNTSLYISGQFSAALCGVCVDGWYWRSQVTYLCRNRFCVRFNMFCWN